MSGVFLKIFNMSIAAGWLILAVVLLRLLLRKAPKAFTGLLWIVVGVRLVCPFSFESVFSLIPSGETVPAEIVTERFPSIDSGIGMVDQAFGTYVMPTLYPEADTGATPMQMVTFIAAVVWLLGIAVMLAYALVSYLRLRHRVREAAYVRENIWACDSIRTPFILGLFRPRILLPSSLSAEDAESVLAHERAHLHRRDHWWKPLGFLVLAMHWFNPLVWLAYALLCRDIEFACDERVVRTLDADSVRSYSTALLECSAPRRTLSACPLAFGEVGVKGRIKAVLHYRKPAFWVTLVAVVACVITGVCFLTDPASAKLQNLGGHNYEEWFQDTVAVVTLDGESYRPVETVNREQLQRLADLPVSRNTTSNSISEERDKSHTLVLQRKVDTQPSTSSLINGLHIHFSTDFSSVWIVDMVKPTSTYRVLDPAAAQELYEAITEGTVYLDTALPSQLDVFLMQSEMERHAPQNPDHVAVEAHQVLRAKTVGNTITVYAWVMNMTYSCEQGMLKGESGSHVPVAFTVEETVDGYVLKERWTAREGSYHSEDIRKKFPQSIWEEALDPTRYVAANVAICEEKASIHFGLTDGDIPPENRNDSFRALVLEVQADGKGILVEPLAGQWIIGQVHVSTNVTSIHPVPSLRMGDVVQVVFNGEVMETSPAQVHKVVAIYKLEEEMERHYITHAFSVTVPALYVERGFVKVNGYGAEQSIGIYELSSYLEYGGHVAIVRLMPAEEDLYAFGMPHTLYGTMQSPQGDWYNLVAVYPTDVQYSPQAAGTYETMKNELDAMMETLTPAEGWTFIPA